MEARPRACSITPWAALVPPKVFDSQDTLCAQLAALNERIEAKMMAATPSAPEPSTPVAATRFETRRTLEASCASYAGEAVKVKATGRLPFGSDAKKMC